VTVLDLASLTLRRQGVSTTFASGTTVAIDELRAVAAGGGATRGLPGVGPPAAQTTNPTPSLRAEAQRLECAFDSGLAARVVNSAATAILELEQAIVDWSADTEEWTAWNVPGRCCAGW
jgi:hypothetical protein